MVKLVMRYNTHGHQEKSEDVGDMSHQEVVDYLSKLNIPSVAIYMRFTNISKEGGPYSLSSAIDKVKHAEISQEEELQGVIVVDPNPREE